ncbi:hypothetical protein [Pseudomonas sp. 30_B]|uniref:hypothetical protein n=1 Tax=Pseudomonas sp. 30_B TaxID=2813575 RepID=UPI001A9E88C5|nr:hypothetical protein [Pseudomonas sp. 30_B]
MDKSGKQGPNNESSRPKAQVHPQGPRHEAPRLSRAEEYSTPKSRAEAGRQKLSDAVSDAGRMAHPTGEAKNAETVQHAARGDDDLMSEEQHRS